MPQVFQVLKCYKCFVFQIHQTKKTNKFECKICGEKQSIKRHYGIGTGKECRVHVQKLNHLRGNIETQPITQPESNSDDEYEDSEKNETIENYMANPNKCSKWSAFIDNEKETEASEDPMFLGDKEIFLEIPKKKKTRRLKAKEKTRDSEKYLDCGAMSKVELKSISRLSNNNIDSFESQENLPMQGNILLNNDTNITDYKQLFCNSVENPIIEKAADKPVDLVNKNSRWAQYVDNEDQTDIQSKKLSNCDLKECVLNSNNLFSLSDDNDLEQVLDF